MSTDVLPPGTGLEGVFVLSGALEHGIPGAERASVTSTGDQPERIASAIARAEHIVDEAGPSYVSCREKLHALKQRLREERFHLAVLGQFKRGKSTLLNALLEEEALPVSVIPLTAIPTFIRSGDRRHARVIFNGGESSIERDAANTQELSEFLAQYVTEEANPANRLGVSYVEVLHPAPFLRAGVVLIDTPGIGSTFRHNTEATLNFLPQCDAALFIVSRVRPISEVEVDFLKEILDKTARTFFVLNKTDYLAGDELAETIGFLKQALKDHVGIGEEAHVFCVSARAALQARLSGDEAGWVKSGMQAVQEHLVDFLANQKSAALQEAIRRKAQPVISDAPLRIGISLESLRMPIEQLEERMRLLQTKLDEVESQRVAQLDVLEGDRKRMVALLEDQAAQLRGKARSRLLEVVREAVSDRVVSDEDDVRGRMADAVPALFERELGELSRTFEQRVQDVFVQHRRRADELVDSIRRAAAELFSVPYHKSEEREGFEIKRRPYWITHHWSYSLSLLPENLFDRLLPARIRRSRAKHRLQAQIETVVKQNVENVRWTTLQNLEDTFRGFARQIDEQHCEAVPATRDVIEAAYVQRREHAEAVESDAARLESALHSLDQVRREIESLSKIN
jgi:GTPase Era involved in 16S rRNA processing